MVVLRSGMSCEGFGSGPSGVAYRDGPHQSTPLPNHSLHDPTAQPPRMSFEVPEDCRYLETHEWVRLEDGRARVGISDFAQDELGDVVFVELPGEGDSVEQDDDFGVIESIKAVSDLYAPVSGTVAATNERLVDEPELVNEDPFGDGWMLELEDIDESELDALLPPEAYREQIE